MSKIIIIGILVLAVLGAAFVYSHGLVAQKKPEPKSVENITLAMPDLPTTALIYIAQNKGYFKEEGVNITFKKFATGRDALADALSGGSDVAVVFESPVVKQIYQGKDLSIITTLHASSKNSALIGRVDKGINRIEDIKGKKIGVPQGTASEYFLTSYLTSEGIKLSDVTLVNGEFKEMQGMLSRGEVDAVVAFNPYFYDIKKEFPPDKIVIFRSDIYTERSLLVGSTLVIKNRGVALIRMLKALARAEDFVKANNDEALKLVILSLPSIPEESVRGTWSEFTLELKLDNVLLTLLEKEGQWFKDNNVYTDPLPDFRKSIFTDYLKKVKPDAVTVF